MLRKLRRRAYRSWRAKCKQSQVWGACSPTPFSPPHKKATRYRATWLRQSLFWQTHLTRQKRPKARKPQTTPQLPYDRKLRVAALNVQGFADTLKLKNCIQIIQEHNLDLIILTETKSTNYYSYISEEHLVILSGNSRDKHAGVGAIISPRLRPYLADVIQVNPRILHLCFQKRGGAIHVVGCYAPHSKLDFDTVREPFWEQLETHVNKIPQPEPVYVTGDFNVRFQATHKNDGGGVGSLYIWQGHTIH